MELLSGEQLYTIGPRCVDQKLYRPSGFRQKDAESIIIVPPVGTFLGTSGLYCKRVMTCPINMITLIIDDSRGFNWNCRIVAKVMKSYWQWKRISRKQSARWQHLSRLKVSTLISLQKNFVVKKRNNLYYGLGMPSGGWKSPILEASFMIIFLYDYSKGHLHIPLAKFKSSW